MSSFIEEIKLYKDRVVYETNNRFVIKLKDNMYLSIVDNTHANVANIVMNINLSMSMFPVIKCYSETALMNGNDVYYDNAYGYSDVLTQKNKEELIKEIDRVINIFK